VTFPGLTAAQTQAGLCALAAVAILSELSRRVALRHGLVDRPNRHKAHRQPTPYLGGAAIMAGTLLPVALTARGWSAPFIEIVLGAALLGLLGLADDIRPLSPVLRLIVEAAAAALVVSCGVRLPIFGNAFDDAVTVLWIVVLTNSFNLLDNMDGAAAAVGSATAAVLAVSAAAAGRPDVAVLLFALSAGCVGFLIHNWAPARIFMGDAGSLFLGFVIATAAVVVYTTRGGHPALTAVWLVTFIPTLDTAVVLISRHRAGRPLLTGGTDHVSHRLRRLGLSVPQVGLAMSALAAATSLTGMLVGRGSLSPVDVLLAGAVSAAAMTWGLLRVPGYPKAIRPRSALRPAPRVLGPAPGDGDAGPPDPKRPTRA